jgi:hypothetical protein
MSGLLSGQIGASELQPVPNVYQFEGDQIWIMKRNGVVVRKMDVERALQTQGIRIRGPRGGEITFCPPGGCDPPQYTPPQQEPPKFDMPGDEKPKLDLPLTADTSGADISLATIAAVAAGALGAFAGYKQQMNDPDLVEEAVKSEKSTTPALEVVK